MKSSPKSEKNPASPAEQLRKYFAAVPPATRAELKRIRATIRAEAPAAVESFSYGIPGFKLEGKSLIWYAGWKEHTSMYPLTAGAKAAVGTQLAKYRTSKGTIQFPLSEPVPLNVVKRIVKARVAEIRKSSKR
jgi:uncharacterized protein YdhG (YjbR/CyaY superfamily)